MRKLQALVPPQKHQINRQGDKNNFIGTLKTSQRSTATKQKLNQEKSTFNMVGNFIAFLLTLSHLPSMVKSGGSSLIPGFPFGMERAGQNCLQHSDLSVGHLRVWSCLTQSSDRGHWHILDLRLEAVEGSGGCVHENCKGNADPWAPGGKTVWTEHYNRTSKAIGSQDETLGNQDFSMQPEIIRVGGGGNTHIDQVRTHVQKRPEKTLNHNPSLILRLRGS